MDEVCSVCCFGDGDSFTYDPNPNSFNDSPNFSDYPPQPQYEPYSCELCGNDSHHGYDCPPRFPLVYEQEPSYNQNFSDNYYPQNSPSFPQQYLCCTRCGGPHEIFQCQQLIFYEPKPCFNQNFDNDNFPQTSPNFPQQYLCCENCGGPHETFQCQPMNQNYYEPNPCYNSNSSGFDQIQPPQYFVVHQLPQEMSTEMLHARENLMEAIQAFLKKYDQIPPKEKSMALLLAEERFLKIKQAVEEEQNQPENIQELLLKLINDLQILNGIQLKQEEQAAKVSSQYWKPPIFYDDDDDYDYEESTIPLNEIVSQIPPSIAITLVLPTLEPKDSRIMGDEHLSTIPEKESDEFIKSSVEDLVPIPSESKDTSESNKNIKSKDSYVSNLDEPVLLVTPLSEFNEDECFDPSGDVDEIKFLLHHDPSTPKISVASILEGFTDEPPLEENDDLFDLESKENEWKKILYDAPIDDLMTEDKVFDPGIHKKKISPTYVSLSFEDRHYLSFTYVIRIFLPYFTYPVNSSLPLSSGSEDIIFDPGISAFHFSSLKPVAYECPLEDCPDFEDSRAHEIPSGEIKVHIEVLSVLWGNRLPIHDGSLPLSSLDLFVKIPSGESKGRIEVLSVLWGNRLPIPDGSLPLSRVTISSWYDKPERDGLMAYLPAYAGAYRLALRAFQSLFRAKD
ncbi:hypothetical protein Tco_1030926 [Tanacetum coccineum]|uniref:Uncharacterized protein n=1 Tax=Tanacetum coccineum TaxID=301880 RepID=A0ABQ5G911_9ASTR